MITNATTAVIGITEYVLIAVAVFMVLGVPVAVLVGLWLWQRSKRVPPAIQQSQGPMSGTRS